RPAGRLLRQVRVGDGDDHEPRLDRLVERHRELRRGPVQGRSARRGDRPQQVGVRERRRRSGQEDRSDADGERQATREPHASGRLAPETRPTPASTAATIATISATIPSIELPPPPRDDFASTAGAGVSELSGPFQSTTEPSEKVCRTSNVYGF